MTNTNILMLISVKIRLWIYLYATKTLSYYNNSGLLVENAHVLNCNILIINNGSNFAWYKIFHMKSDKKINRMKIKKNTKSVIKFNITSNSLLPFIYLLMFNSSISITSFDSYLLSNLTTSYANTHLRPYEVSLKCRLFKNERGELVKTVNKVICLACWYSWTRPATRYGIRGKTQTWQELGFSCRPLTSTPLISLLPPFQIDDDSFHGKSNCFMTHMEIPDVFFNKRFSTDSTVELNMLHDTREATVATNPLLIARGSRRQHKLSCPPCYHLPIYCHANPTALSATLLLFLLSSLSIR